MCHVYCTYTDFKKLFYFCVSLHQSLQLKKTWHVLLAAMYTHISDFMNSILSVEHQQRDCSLVTRTNIVIASECLANRRCKIIIFSYS